MHEFTWDAIAQYITPRDVHNHLILNPQNAGSYKRCQNMVWQKIYEQLPRKIHNFQNMGYSTRDIFCIKLVKYGFIPSVGDAENVSNFIWKRTPTMFEEWSCPSVEIMRYYWDIQFKNFKDRKLVDKICQDVILLLPGSKIKCSTCLWDIPESHMNDQFNCCYCISKLNPNAELQKCLHDGTIPVITS